MAYPENMSVSFPLPDCAKPGPGEKLEALQLSRPRGGPCTAVLRPDWLFAADIHRDLTPPEPHRPFILSHAFPQVSAVWPPIPDDTEPSDLLRVIMATLRAAECMRPDSSKEKWTADDNMVFASARALFATPALSGWLSSHPDNARSLCHAMEDNPAWLGSTESARLPAVALALSEAGHPFRKEWVARLARMDSVLLRPEIPVHRMIEFGLNPLSVARRIRPKVLSEDAYRAIAGTGQEDAILFMVAHQLASPTPQLLMPDVPDGWWGERAESDQPNPPVYGPPESRLMRVLSGLMDAGDKIRTEKGQVAFRDKVTEFIARTGAAQVLGAEGVRHIDATAGFTNWGVTKAMSAGGDLVSMTLAAAEAEMWLRNTPKAVGSRFNACLRPLVYGGPPFPSASTLGPIMERWANARLSVAVNPSSTSVPDMMAEHPDPLCRVIGTSDALSEWSREWFGTVLPGASASCRLAVCKLMAMTIFRPKDMHGALLLAIEDGMADPVMGDLRLNAMQLPDDLREDFVVFAEKVLGANPSISEEHLPAMRTLIQTLSPRAVSGKPTAPRRIRGGSG